MNKIIEWIKRNQKIIFILAGFLILLKFVSPNTVVPVMTQSLFGGWEWGITLSFLLGIVGAILIVFPDPATTAIGIVVVGVSLFFGSYSIIQALNSLFEGAGAIALIVFIAYAGYFLAKNWKQILKKIR